MTVRLAITLLAAAGIAGPALANNTTSSSNQDTNAQASMSQSGANLDSDQVRQVQQALQDKGNAQKLKTDGMWGPQTEHALERFQKAQNINANGELDSQTIAALGLKDADFQSGGAMRSSGGQSSSGQSAPGSDSAKSSASQASSPNSGTSSSGGANSSMTPSSTPSASPPAPKSSP